jgi:predicted RNase H-like HicB family nuclease
MCAKIDFEMLNRKAYKNGLGHTDSFSSIGIAMDTLVTVELIPDPEIGGFTARLPDIPAYGEGETEAEAIADLKEALRAYIEAFGIDDARARANVPLMVRDER